MSLRVYLLREIAWLNMASQSSKVQVKPSIVNICSIWHGHANSEIGEGNQTMKYG